MAYFRPPSPMCHLMTLAWTPSPRRYDVTFRFSQKLQKKLANIQKYGTTFLEKMSRDTLSPLSGIWWHFPLPPPPKKKCHVLFEWPPLPLQKLTQIFDLRTWLTWSNWSCTIWRTRYQFHQHFRGAFTHEDPKSAKRYLQLYWIFDNFGICTCTSFAKICW